MDFVKSLFIAASGLKAQNGRMRVIAENIANASSTGRTPQEEPYRRKIPTFQVALDREMGAEMVKLGKIEMDQSDFGRKYEPGHPAADENGYVRVPNVNTLIETVDMRDAQRTYEANLNVITTTRRMLQRTFEILRA
ncbi:flagellar basal body rod protein FlgC [Rhizobiales bacterium]|uniref:flagellar basal body rod protein FlgC n=1 Tax=Hongsoonwoonella zoysiae TaxID=2821844 RepID=UPI001560E566|nr:flagellar basal body rod protein FlgC [Hongsoonwoonella zoysiae]NRG18027.1 flagellar basal body rod protein FlgC [Hongsoonwoonella zoysiae]